MKREAERVKAREATAYKLKDAVTTDDIVALTSAIRQAELIAVDPVTILLARHRLTELELLQSDRANAERVLKEKRQGTALQPLQQAIWNAEKTGVSSRHLELGRKRLEELAHQQVLKERAHAVLHAATPHGDQVVLQNAVKNAEASGVDISMVEASKTKLLELDQKRRLHGRSGNLLVEAVAKGDRCGLEHALHESERHDVDPVALALGRHRLTWTVQRLTGRRL